MSASPDITSDDAFAVTMENDELKRRSLRGSFVTVGAQVAKMLIQFGSQIVLARLLFPSDFGLLAMVYPIIGFIQIFNDIGLGQAIVQRATLDQKQVSSLFWVNVGLSMLLALIVAMAAPIASMIYAEPRVTGLMIVLGLMIPVTALGIHPNALLSRQMRFSLMARNEIITTALGVIVAAACAWHGWSYWSLVVGQASSVVGGNTLAWLACKWRPSRPQLSDSIRADLKFGGSLTGANFANFLTTSADNIIIGVMAGRTALGMYDRSYRLVVQPLGQMLAPISRVAVPLLSRLLDKPDEYRSAYLKIYRSLILVTVPAMVVCIVNGPALVNLALGPRWSAAGPIFAWICVGGLTSGIYSSAFWLFISQARTPDMMRFMAIASVLNVGSFVGGAYWGVTGVAAGAALMFVCISTPLVLYGATRTGPVNTKDLIRHGWPFAAQALLAFLLLEGIKRGFDLPAFFELALATLVSYSTFFGLSLIVPGVRQLFRDLLRHGLASFKPAH